MIAPGRGLSRQDKIEQAVRDGFDERYLDTASGRGLPCCGHEAERHGPEAGGCIECRCRIVPGRTSTSCQGHVRACTHETGPFACAVCVRERAITGRMWCDDLDNCGGPGCMDDVSAPARVRS